ncbi:unnamed protein product, partial [Prorocentrum cordatum]
PRRRRLGRPPRAAGGGRQRRPALRPPASSAPGASRWRPRGEGDHAGGATGVPGRGEGPYEAGVALPCKLLRGRCAQAWSNTRFLTLPLRPPASPPPLYIAGSPRFSLGRSAFDESSGVVSAAEDLAVPLWNPALRKQGPRGPRARARGDPKPPDLLAAPPPPSPGVHERARAARDGPPARAGTAAPLTAGRSGAKPCESRAREDVARARGDS